MARPLKRITFVHRDPTLAPSDFAGAWREAVERAVAESRVRPERLTLCYVRPGGRFDGVAMAWSPVDDDWASPPGTVDRSCTLKMVVDERTVDGEDWLAGRWLGSGRATVPVLIGCIEAIPGLSRTDFREYWWERHRPLANRLVPKDLGPIAYVHNYVRPGEPGPWAGVGELYEQSLATAKERGRWFESEAAGPLVEDEDRFLMRATRLVLVADQQVLIAG